jgi:tetratricopeptide (TPR) repeat protein
VRARALAVLAFVAGTLGSAAARAEPTLWQRARSTDVRAEARLLAALERTLDARAQVSFDPALAEGLGRAALAMSDLAGIREPKDPRLACVMARVLLTAGARRAREAQQLLEAALPRLPVGMLAAEAWYSLALASSELDEPRKAQHAYSRTIELSWDQELRATSYYNRGEESMRLGELNLALADYERAVALAEGPDTEALARFGLAVALERRADLPAAFQELDRALAIVLPVPPYATEDPLELPNVFFVPAYERHYLEALIAMARARRLQGSVRRDLYGRAGSAWDAYLAAATGNEPWFDHARAHRERCRRESEAPDAARSPRRGRPE